MKECGVAFAYTHKVSGCVLGVTFSPFKEGERETEVGRGDVKRGEEERGMGGR